MYFYKKMKDHILTTSLLIFVGTKVRNAFPRKKLIRKRIKKDGVTFLTKDSSFVSSSKYWYKIFLHLGGKKLLYIRFFLD